MQRENSQIRITSPHDQKYYHLACIQSASIGLPGILIGSHLANQYDPGIAICSIIVGNLILWLIGLGIISMAYQDRINAVENIKNYIGKTGGILIALVLLFAFLAWYALQINHTIDTLGKLIHSNDQTSKNISIRIGAGFGFLTALLAIGGIKLLKRITLICLPLFIIYHFYSIFSSDYSLASWTWSLSFPAIMITVLLLLPGIINLPTFFRHAHSRADSYLGLIFMTIFNTFLECSAIWIDFGQKLPAKDHLHYVTLYITPILIIILLLTCNNLMNIYFASACYETFIPHFSGTKGHAIMGLLGTAVYTFVQISPPIEFMVDLLNCYISNIGLVLLISFLIRVFIRHRPRRKEKLITLSSWIVGSMFGTLLKIQNPLDEIHFILAGGIASTLFFLFVIFIEEAVWSCNKIISSKESS